MVSTVSRQAFAGGAQDQKWQRTDKKDGGIGGLRKGCRRIGNEPFREENTDMEDDSGKADMGVDERRGIKDKNTFCRGTDGKRTPGAMGDLVQSQQKISTWYVGFKAAMDESVLVGTSRTAP